MSSREFSTLQANPANFLPTQRLKLFVSSAFNAVKGDAPTEYQFTVTTASTPTLAANGELTVDLTLNGTTDLTLYEGTRFEFAADQVFYLGEEVTFNAGNSYAIAGITMESDGNQTAPAADDTITISSVIPYYSANTLGLSDNGEVIEDNVFSNGFAMEKAMIGLNQSVDVSGPRVIGDPGILVLKECRNTGKTARFEVIYPFCNGYELFTGIVPDVPRNNERAGFQQINATIQVTGLITENVA